MDFRSLLTRKLGLSALGVLLLAAFVVIVMRSGPLAPKRVTTVKAQAARIEPALFGIGTVQARRSYLIGPTSAGRVLRVQADVGDRVKAGQLLAEMDPVDLADRTVALEASIARASSACALATALRQEAQARQALAAINVKRYADLGAQNFVSGSVVETRVQEQTSAQAALAAAQANVAAAQQDLARLRAERNALAQQARNLRLVAPADAFVISRDAEPGSTAVAGQAVLRLVQPDSLWIEARLDQARSAGLAVGQPVQIALRSAPQPALAGKVARVDPQSDAVTEERIVQVVFDTVPPGLSIGELAEVTVKLPATQSALVLPNASVQQRGEQMGVWVLGAGKSRFVPVRLGQASLDGQVQVLEGLKAGDEVVAYSEKQLAEGDRVRVVPSLVRAGS
jgi:HlyD family secretion protein